MCRFSRAQKHQNWCVREILGRSAAETGRVEGPGGGAGPSPSGPRLSLCSPAGDWKALPLSFPCGERVNRVGVACGAGDVPSTGPAAPPSAGRCLIPGILSEHHQVPGVASLPGRQLCEADKFLGLMCPGGGGRRGQLAAQIAGNNANNSEARETAGESGRVRPGGQGGLPGGVPRAGWRPGRTGQGSVLGPRRRGLACPAGEEFGF